MEKGSTGQVVTPTAETWNAMVDSANWYSRQVKLGWPGGSNQWMPTPDFVRVSNGSAAARPLGEMLELADLSVGAVRQAEPMFSGVTYTAEGRPFAVLREDTPTGKFGVAQVSGACVAEVAVNDTSHNFAEPVVGSHVLSSSQSGPVQILYKPSATGQQTCFVLLGICCSNGTDDGGDGGGGQDPPVGIDCNAFVPGTTPRTIQVDIAGVINNTCSDCAQTYDRSFDFVQSLFQPCVWQNNTGYQSACAQWFNGKLTLYDYSQFAGTYQFELDIAPTASLASSRFFWRIDVDASSRIDGRTLDLTLPADDRAAVLTCDPRQSVARIRAK